MFIPAFFSAPDYIICGVSGCTIFSDFIS